MAKKKVNIEIPRAGAAAEVPSGDVNIVYNDVRIAGLSETVDATLKTGGTVVQHDIEVEYTKPASTPVLPALSVTVPNDFDENISGVAAATIDESNNLIIIAPYISESITCSFIPQFDDHVNCYVFMGFLGADSDKYNVSVNGVTATYNGRDYGYTLGKTLSSYTDPVTIVVTNKPTEAN